MSHFTTEQLRTMSWDMTNKTTQRLISDLIEARRERDEARREVEQLRLEIEYMRQGFDLILKSEEINPYDAFEIARITINNLTTG